MDITELTLDTLCRRGNIEIPIHKVEHVTERETVTERASHVHLLANVNKNNT